MAKFQSNISILERIIASLSYITMGMAGFIWLIISLFTKAPLKKFLQYHIFQSIFISITIFIISYIINFCCNILSIIPFLSKLIAQVTFLLNMPIFIQYSIIQIIIYLFIIYLAISSLLGLYSYVPWVSGIIAQNVRR